MIIYKPILQQLHVTANHALDVLRLDLLDKEVSGNKWFKLKYNLQKAQEENHHTIVTFGGAHSNHIAAAAAACARAGIKLVLVIRGEESEDLNDTLSVAKELGARLFYISRHQYREKNSLLFSEMLQQKFGRHYLIPEGGNNLEGARGCMEILDTQWRYDYIACACGTGTTYAGLLAGLTNNETLIGINVLRGKNTLPDDAHQLALQLKPEVNTIMGNEGFEEARINNHAISNHYCFSGYAGYDKALVDFKETFENSYQIPLDYVYTNKLFYAVFDLMKRHKFKPASRILVIHSGGLQGNNGFETRYHLKPIR